jgi:ATP/ADP translocase/HEAT repeat protein
MIPSPPDRTVGQRLAKVFSVEPGEGKSVSLMLAHAFAMGISTTFFETAASALFLTRFDKGATLSYVYLAAAVVNTVTGLIYSRLRERMSFANLMLTTLLFLLAVGFAFRIGLSASGAAWIVFGLFVWYRVISILTDLEFWAVAARLFDVRQSKRLFSLIGTGEVIARIAGSFSIPFLVRWMDVKEMILLSAVGFVACLVILLVIFQANPEMAASEKKKKKKDQKDAKPGADAQSGRSVTMAAIRAETKKAEPEPPSGARGALAKIFSNRYLTLIIVLQIFGTFGKYFVDFAFLQQVKGGAGGRQMKKEDIAAFIGLFNGITQVINLFTRVFLSGRLLSKFGVKTGLLILPILQLACSIAIIFAGGFGMAAPVLFWLVILDQGIYKTLKHPIDNPAFKVLYQPLAKEQRLATQIALEVIVAPISIAAAGLVMLLFSTVIPYSPASFAWPLSLAFAGWLAAAWFTYRQYSAALVKALDTHVLDDATLTLTDDSALRVLRAKLASDYPGDVVYALTLLQKSEHPKVDAFIAEAVTHRSPEVRAFALGAVERRVQRTALPLVTATLDREEPPTVRAAAIRALLALDDSAAARVRVGAMLAPGEIEIRCAAIAALLLNDAPLEIRGKAENALRTLAGSRKPEERAASARLLAELGPRWSNDLLFELMGDDDTFVRRTALSTAGRNANSRLAERLVENLGDPAWCRTAASALIEAGPNALPELEKALARPDTPIPVLCRAVHVCGRIPGDEAFTLVRNKMDAENPWVRAQALRALSFRGWQPAVADFPAVLEVVRREAGEAAWKLAARIDLAAEPKAERLVEALDWSIRQSRNRMLVLLSFLHDSKPILRARENVDHPSREKRAYAVEIVDITVADPAKKLMLPLIEELSPERRLEALDHEFPQKRETIEERLREILAVRTGRLGAWTVICGLDLTARLRLTRLADLVRATGKLACEQIVVEEARAAWNALLNPPDGERPKEDSRLLTIEKVIILKSVSVFADLAEELLAKIAAVLQEEQVEKGETLFSKGDVGDSMYIVIEGKIRIQDGEKILNLLGEREILGEMALFDEQPRSASAIAETPVRLLKLERDALLEVMTDHVEVVRGVLRVLCGRLRRANILK